jgi:hypothetical protein
MNKPDFSAITRHSVQREPQLKSGIPQAIPYGTRIYSCECCNDTGVVQTWKLNRWALAPGDEPLNSTTSLPVFCQMLTSCGNATMQVFAGSRDNDESAPRITEVNLLRGNSNGDSCLREQIAKGKLKCLTPEQSRYIHNKVLEYRELLACTEAGRQYVEDVKEACRKALPSPEAQKTRLGNGRLMHIGELLRLPQLPEEPDWDAVTAQARVQPSNPRDFTPTQGATPAQPLDLPLTPEELDW